MTDTAIDFSALPDEVLARLELADLVLTARGTGVEAVAAFGQYVFGVSPVKHHRAWLEAKLNHRRVVIVAPPESAKTTWSIILMAWSIGKRAWTTNCFVSATEGAANTMAKTVAECIENNARWKDIFPSVVPNKDKGWSRDGYEVIDNSISTERWTTLTATKKDPTLMAGGVGSARLNGIRITGRMECDDIHDRMSKESETVCADTVSFVKDTILSRVTQRAFFGMEQTRWNKKDCVGYIKEKLAHIYTIFEHPAIDLATGESYWAEQWSLERLEEKREEIDDLYFRLIYLGDDTAMDGAILKAEWLVPFPAGQIDKNWVVVYGVDPAFKKEQMVETKRRKRSRFVLTKMRIAPFGLVIENIIAGYFSEPEAEDLLVSHAALDKPIKVMIETNGVGDPFYQSLVRRTSLPVVPQHTSRDVVAHAQEMSPDFRKGQIRVSDENTEGLRLFREEWLALGGNGTFDTISSTYYAYLAGRHALWRDDAPVARRKAENAGRTMGQMEAIERAYYG